MPPSASVSSVSLKTQAALFTPETASHYGRIGGSVTSKAKTRAARRNGRKGGRPRKIIREPAAILEPRGPVQAGDARSTWEPRSTSLRLVPVTLAVAKAFVARHHRHNPNSKAAWKFGVGVVDDAGELVGVAMAGLPTARMAMRSGLLEVNRTCTIGVRNANSILYGAIARAAKALGYEKLITYTLPEESGASLRAVGWSVESNCAGSGKSWLEARGTGTGDIVDGVSVRIPGLKYRWMKLL